MAAKSWTIFDQPTNTHVGHSFQVTEDDAPGTSPFQVRFSRGSTGLSQGVEQVTIDNGALRFVVLPTRGMSLWKAWWGEEHIGWNSPTRGPVHPSFVPLMEPSGLGWLDGFDELLVRCGLESNGAPEFDGNGQLKYPLHGKIGNKPAYRLEVAIVDDELVLTGWVEETRFHFVKLRMKSTVRTKLGSTTIDIEDEITNISASPAEMQMLYHVNFGAPLLDAGSQVVAAVDEVVPRNAHAATGMDSWASYSAEVPGFEEQVYFASLLRDANGFTTALLKNAHATRGAALRFSPAQLPCLSVWKNTTATEDGFVTGIEPGTNFPNPRRFEGDKGRVIRLDGKQSTVLRLGIDYLTTEESVAKVAQQIGQIQSQKEPTVHPQPLADWCAP